MEPQILSLSGQPNKGRDGKILHLEEALGLLKTMLETYIGSHFPRDGIAVSKLDEITQPAREIVRKDQEPWDDKEVPPNKTTGMS